MYTANLANIIERYASFGYGRPRGSYPVFPFSMNSNALAIIDGAAAALRSLPFLSFYLVSALQTRKEFNNHLMSSCLLKVFAYPCPSNRDQKGSLRWI